MDSNQTNITNLVRRCVFCFFTPLISILSTQTLAAAPLGPDNLEYQGSFRVPIGESGGSTFAYGGNALAWRDRNPGDSQDRGSLYMVGHATDQLVAEISIPAPIISAGKNVADLPVAEFLQPFADITGGLASRIVGNPLGQGLAGAPRIGGLAWLNRDGIGEIHWTVWKYYNVDAQQLAGHGVSSVDLSAPNGRGGWTLGNYHNQSTAGYLFTVPKLWADQYLGGKRLVAGQNSVNGNATSSWGPSMFSYSPWQHPVQPVPENATLDVSALTNYPYNNGDDSTHFPGYEPTDFWGGATWISTGDRHGVVVVGSKALGPTRYGQPNPGDCSPYQGYHGDPYEPQMLFFNVDDLVNAANGGRSPESVRSSAMYRPAPDMYDNCDGMLSGAAFDPGRQLLYIAQPNADTLNQYEPRPLVHVYKVSSQGGGGGSTPKLTARDVDSNESDGIARVFFNLDQPTNDDVSFTVFTREVTANQGADYWGFTQQLSIAAGQQQASVTVTLLDDAVAEQQESLSVRIIDPTDNVEVVDDIASVTINDDDTSNTPALRIFGGVIDESGGSVTVRVELQRPVDADVLLFTQSKTAVSGSDFYGMSRLLSFRNGETVINIDVQIIDDTMTEDDEYFVVRLANPLGATIAQSSRFVRIRDND